MYEMETDLDLKISNMIDLTYSYSCCFDDYVIEKMFNAYRHVCISDFFITLVENFVILIKALLAFLKQV